MLLDNKQIMFVNLVVFDVCIIPSYKYSGTFIGFCKARQVKLKPEVFAPRQWKHPNLAFVHFAIIGI